MRESPVRGARAPRTSGGETTRPWGPAALEADRRATVEWQARHASKRDRWIRRNAYYYENLERLLRYVIEPQKSVLSLRCETGHLLHAVRPARGLGIELGREMVDIARAKYPSLEFRQADPEELVLDEQFDYVLFQNVSDTTDIIRALRNIQSACSPHTRLVIYAYNHLYQPLIRFAERTKLKFPLKEPSWLSDLDLENLLEVTDFELLRTFRTVIVPYRIPLVSGFMNRVIGRLPILDKLCLVKVLVARPMRRPSDASTLSVSVVVPCKNEEGNVEPVVRRMPDMGRHTQIIFCDDQSTDGTAEGVRRMQHRYPGKDIVLVEGPGAGKARNVWRGFDAATGEVLIILDADLAVMPEELPYFFEAIASGKGELINGSRLVYPVTYRAMKWFNMLGNKAFGVAFSFLLGQPIRDTLCGTKVLWRRDWERIRKLVGSWGPEDRWGDFDLLLSAARLNLRILDLPVHYQERIHGTTKMVRVVSNGVRMMRVWLAGLWDLRGAF